MSWFDNIIANEIVSRMKDSTPENTREAIENNVLLFKNVTDEEWEKYRKRIQMVPGLKLDYDAIVDALDANRPEILVVITSTPGGVAWLREQVRIGQEKLGTVKPSSMRFHSR